MNKEFSHCVQMPVNIALIKYIGKQDSDDGLNQALHPCLSFTLKNIYSQVCLHYQPGLTQDVMLTHPKSPPLAHRDRVRFTDHLATIKRHMQFEGCFSIDSYNNFPLSAGLASSASSFAALSSCAIQSIEAIRNTASQDKLSLLEQARLSRYGSGSACRSFYGPYCLWDGDNITQQSFAEWDELQHVVLMFSSSQKHVSSSQAHTLVQTSDGFAKRQELISARCADLMKAMKEKDWASAHRLIWTDFIEMHRLFHTSKPSFTYCTPKVKRALEFLQGWWYNHADGPLVTMDAGSNIHLLFRPDQLYERTRLLKKFSDVPMLFGTPQVEQAKMPATS